MGILNLKKSKTEKDVPKQARKLAVVDAAKKPTVASAPLGVFDPHVLIRPRVTEKAGVLSAGGRSVAVFEVSTRADKKSVALAVKSLYKVTPEKVAILRIPPKKKMVRGRAAKGKAGYKAYVYLKAGDKIEAV